MSHAKSSSESVLRCCKGYRPRDASTTDDPTARGHRPAAASHPQRVRERRQRRVRRRSRAASTCCGSTSATPARHRRHRAVARSRQPRRAHRGIRSRPRRRCCCSATPTSCRPTKTRWRHDPFGGELIDHADGVAGGVGSRRGRHAQPHRVDGRRHAPAGRRRASRRGARSSTPPSPTRRRSAPGAPPTSSTTHRDAVAGRLRHHRGRRLPAAVADRHEAPGDRRREGHPLVHAAGDRHARATPRSPTAPTTPWSPRPRSCDGSTEFRPPTVLHDIWRRFLGSMDLPDELTAPLLDEADLRGRPRRAAARHGPPVPRLHAHDLRPDGRARRHEDQRHPRHRRPRDRHPHAARVRSPADVHRLLDEALGDLARPGRGHRLARRPLDGVAGRDAAVGRDRPRR